MRKSPSDEKSKSEPAPLAAWAGLGALGIVYGDLGTSPLYTLKAVVQASGPAFTHAAALGSLSLIVWTLLITISLKYCLLVMRADNHGEGGILALMSLVGASRFRKATWALTAAGLIGAGLLYGDGIITPSISVLSALEGLNTATPSFKPYIVPAAIAILVALFAFQFLGTARIGKAFGPIMLVWFVAIGGLGLVAILRHPQVIAALDPRYGLAFLRHAGLTGIAILGAVFLCTTGGEALYADMGHFGRFPIRLAWYCVVLPALLLSYAGQVALFLDGPAKMADNPFFALCPPVALYPLVGLATVATIIASQAIITGSFSLTRQAMQLGWLPGVTIRQTSDRYGQIYVPLVNSLMMVATVLLTLAFRSSDALAGAYGTAVSTTMLLTTILLWSAMRRVWGWSLVHAVPIVALLLVVDGAFFAANIAKVMEGGWIPLTLGLCIFGIMFVWGRGLDAVHRRIAYRGETTEVFLARLKKDKVVRVPGTAVFLSRPQKTVPALLVQHAEHMGALQETVVELMVLFETIPHIPLAERAEAKLVAQGLWRVTARFGFMDQPDLGAALQNCEGFTQATDPKHAVYFSARDLITHDPAHPRLSRWECYVFAFLFRNSTKLVDRFNLPPDRFVEIARQIKI